MSDDGRIYTCPMHPQIRQKGPGSCPICGMALEPLVAAGEEGRDPELADMTRRFWVSLVLTLPLLAAVMGDMIPGAPIRHAVPARVLAWAQLVLATPVVLWGGWPFFVRGWASIVNKSLNMFTLIALGVGVAYAYSVVAVVAPGLFPPSFRTHGGSPPRRRGAYATTAATRRSRSSTFGSATGCACVPAKASPSTAGCSRARAPSTSRW